MFKQLGQYTKAIGAAVTAFAGYYVVAGRAGSPGGEAITGAEWRDMIVLAVAAGILVWAVPNSGGDKPA